LAIYTANTAAPSPTPSVQLVAVPAAVTAYRAVKPAALTKPQRIPPITGRRGLTVKAANLAKYLQATYPDITSIGGVRACDRFMEHCRGLALDVMVGKNTGLGDRVAFDVLGRRDVQFVLWQKTYRKPNGLSRWMTDRGSPTDNHFDHVHIRVVG
jgi:hypothetical protein